MFVGLFYFYTGAFVHEIGVDKGLRFIQTSFLITGPVARSARHCATEGG